VSKESNFWRHIRRNIQKGQWERIETRLDGVPDCCCLYGDNRVHWVELKSVSRWPVRVKTNFDLRPEQAMWLLRWRRRGGRSWLFVQIADEFLLFDGKYALTILRKIDQDQAYALAMKKWVNQIDWDDFENTF
jgi:hypothetical protein